MSARTTPPVEARPPTIQFQRKKRQVHGGRPDRGFALCGTLKAADAAHPIDTQRMEKTLREDREERSEKKRSGSRGWVPGTYTLDLLLLLYPRLYSEHNSSAKYLPAWPAHKSSKESQREILKTIEKVLITLTANATPISVFLYIETRVCSGLT